MRRVLSTTGIMSTAHVNDNRPTDAAPVLATHPCDKCGSPVEQFDLFCTSCGQEQILSAEAVPAEAIPAAHRASIQCQNCSATIAVDPDQRSYVCPFCETPFVVDPSPEGSGRQDPELVIPASVTREKALGNFKQWIARGGIFTPRTLSKVIQIEKHLYGVYLPFWSFSLRTESSWSTRIGEYWYKTESYTTSEKGKTVRKTRRVRKTEWWDLAGRFHEFYSGYLVAAGRGLSQGETDAVGPFYLSALRRYDPKYIVGWPCEEYTIDHDEAIKICKSVFAQREKDNIASHLPGDTYSDLDVRTSFHDIGTDLILAPVHILVYRYKEKLFRVLVNGQTGEVVGRKPTSTAKIISAILLVLLIVCGGIGLLVLLGGLAGGSF